MNEDRQIVFVTGADRGLGLALTARLLEKGWRVFAGQYMPDWPELNALAGQFPETLHIVPLDVASTESVQAAAQAVAGIKNRVDLLINNAGIISSTMERSIREGQDYAKIHRGFDVNAVGRCAWWRRFCR